MESFSNEILLKIFVRLPDCRSMIKCRSVCKRWFRLITYSEPVINSFFHSQPNIYKHVIGFREVRRGFRRPYFDLLFSKSETFSSRGPLPETTVLEFSPWPEEEIDIRATFRDLMLVSRRHNHNDNNPQYGVQLSPRDFAVCNLTTEQWVTLPQAPKNEARRWGLVCSGDGGRFAVVLLVPGERPNVLHSLVFRSDIRKWEEKSEFVFPRGWCRVFAIGGAIHWLSHFSLFSYDPLIDESRVVDLPVSQLQYKPEGKEWNFGHRVVGFVAGRLRLWQLYCAIWIQDKPFYLKVWEFEPPQSSSLSSFLWPSEPFSWRLVHGASHKRMRMPTIRILEPLVLAVHPEKVDEVFILFEDHSIWIYSLLKESFEQVGHLPDVESYYHLRMNMDLFTLSYALRPNI